MPQSNKTGAKKVTNKKKNKKKTTSKKITKERVIEKTPTNKKANTKKVTNKASLDSDDHTLKYMELINRIRRAKKPETINRTFEEILAMIEPRIRRVVARFNIPGLGKDDIYQEALYALRFKAIKDYDYKRGVDDGPAPFDRFAILCIRRHLATEFKVSFQNKKKVLNSSISLNQDSNGKDQDLSLINIVPAEEGDVLEDIQKQEYFNNLIKKLYSELSGFEQEVFVLYAKKYSYEEIAEKINQKSDGDKVDIKSIDNALSRIKNKAKFVLDRDDYEL